MIDSFDIEEERQIVADTRWVFLLYLKRLECALFHKRQYESTVEHTE